MTDAGRIGFLIRGDYSKDQEYDFLDVVYYERSSYVAKKKTIGNTPNEDNEYWHIFARGIDLSEGVTGIKGNAESKYRTGDVNITAENIGLGNVPNVTTNDQTPTFSQASSRSNIASGEKMSTIFGKIMKWLADLKAVAFSGAYSDLTGTPKSLPASDVYAWAKSSTKPTYTASEVGAVPVDGTARSALEINNPNISEYSNRIRYDNVNGCTIAVALPGDDDSTEFIFNGQYFYVTLGGEIGCSLGRSQNRWKDVYSRNGTIQTSDRNAKNNIKKLTLEKSRPLVFGLIPSTYMMNDGTSGRTHWGLISQDIEELLKELGWTSLDFAGFIRSPHYEIDIVEEEVVDENGDVVVDESGKPITRKKRVERLVEGQYDYSLRYDEFIAPIIVVVQDHEGRIVTLEKTVKEQGEEIKSLKETIQNQGKQIEALEQMVKQLLETA